MKKKNLIYAVIVAIFMIAVGGLSFKLTNKNQLTGLLLENVEALTQSEGITIICGDHETKGRCWVKSTDLKYCKETTYYACKFSGMQKDSCEEPPCQ